MATAAAIVGSAVIGGIFSSRAASKQAKATQAGIDAQNELLGPFAEAGQAGLADVQSFVNQGGNFADTQDFKDITNLAKAGRGAGFGSGNLLTSLIDFQQTNFRPQRLQELLALPTLGANAAAGQATNVGNLQQSLGATRAGGELGVGNAINSLSFLSLLNRPSAAIGGNTLTGATVAGSGGQTPQQFFADR